MAPPARGVQRQVRDHPGLPDAGEIGQPRPGPVEEGPEAGPIGVALLRQIHRQGHTSDGIEARIDAQKAGQAARGHEHGAQKHQNHRRLETDQQALGVHGTVPPTDQGACPDQRVRPRSPRLQGGQQSGQRASRQADHEAEREHRQVGLDASQPRDAGGAQGDQAVRRQQPQQGARNQSEHGQHQALDQQQTGHAARAGPQRPAQHQLVATRIPPRQKQDGHVDARDEQDQRGRQAEQAERRYHVPDHVLVERDQLEAAGRVGLRMLVPERRRDPVHVALSRLEVRARRQARDRIQDVVVPRVGLPREPAVRDPELALFHAELELEVGG